MTFTAPLGQIFIEFSIFAEFFFAISVDSYLSMQAVNSWEDMEYFSLLSGFLYNWPVDIGIVPVLTAGTQ